MKNITVLLVLVIIFFPISLIFSQEQPFKNSLDFSFGTHFGFVYGQPVELVYPSDTAGELLSELIWPMKPVLYLGLQTDLNYSNPAIIFQFFTSLSFRYGFPGESGTHENRDWMDIETDHLTHFSSHTNITQDFYWLDLVLGVNIPVNKALYIKTSINYTWMHFAFSGNDGYGIYARKSTCMPDCLLSNHIRPGCTSNPRIQHTRYDNINENPHNVSFSDQKVIRYKQDWSIFALGVSVGTDILSPISFELSFLISPFAYCYSKDEHLLTQVTYHDYTNKGLFIEPRGLISFSYRNFVLSLEAAYRYIGRTRGLSYNNKGSSNYFFQEGEAGASLTLFDMRFLISYRL